MAAIRSKHTKPEVAMRKALFATGLRFRIHYGQEKIDIAFPAERIAIFIDGCFWHKCPWHFCMPQSNRAYWIPKIAKNVMRYGKKKKRLQRAGWKVMRFWEHQVKAEPEELAAKIKKIVKA